MTSSHRFHAAAIPLALAALGMTACGGEPRESKAPETATTTTTASAADSNKALVARFAEEVWGKRDLDAINKYVAADLVNHAAIPEAQGAAGLRTIMTKLRTAFPDQTTKVVGISAEGDTVVVRTVVEGTHTGELAFKQPIPATNKHIKIDQVHTYRVKDGKIVECWMVMDRLDLFTQLGIGPSGPKPAP